MAAGIPRLVNVPRLCRCVIHTVGRPREAGWETNAAAEYTRRLGRGLPRVIASTAYYTSDELLAREVARLGHPVVTLDSHGKSLTSDEFAALLFGQLLLLPAGQHAVDVEGEAPPDSSHESDHVEATNSQRSSADLRCARSSASTPQSLLPPRVSFVIGGAAGLPQQLSAPEAPWHEVISMGRMTFPHRVARVLLLEQIFRAREAVAATNYPLGRRGDSPDVRLDGSRSSSPLPSMA
eukprot:TRINITY_DN57244_c0_g1_i1.p1 TRINITY_DN57244_c0_g1~~TRINITY_DN57244_c0_g1_i1.p1  ORF type:complete len:237 (-),score=22.26 TRINITY_DN57244_c0_g1_i1:19-729(-)